jgi:hypothetical protein
MGMNISRLVFCLLQIESFEHCWSSAEEVSSRLVHAVQQTRQAEPRLVYVATGQYDQDFEPFQRRGFTILSPANFSSELDTFRFAPLFSLAMF